MSETFNNLGDVIVYLYKESKRLTAPGLEDAADYLHDYGVKTDELRHLIHQIRQQIGSMHNDLTDEPSDPSDPPDPSDSRIAEQLMRDRLVERIRARRATLKRHGL